MRTNEVYIYKLLLSSSGAHDAGSGGRAGTKSGKHGHVNHDKVLGPGQIYIRFEGLKDPIMTTAASAFGMVSAPVQSTCLYLPSTHVPQYPVGIRVCTLYLV